jgi:hypothetical protein
MLKPSEVVTYKPEVDFIKVDPHELKLEPEILLFNFNPLGIDQDRNNNQKVI